VNDGGGSGTSCGGIKLWTCAAKLSMITARFGEGGNLVAKGN